MMAYLDAVFVIIQQDTSQATYQIQRFEGGKIYINHHAYSESVIIRPHQLIVPWEPKQLNDLKPIHFTPLYPTLPAILLLGTGSSHQIPPMSLLMPFWEKGVGVEIMDSQKACFTYTVLAAEGREVAACILIN